jgi:cytochrome c
MRRIPVFASVLIGLATSLSAPMAHAQNAGAGAATFKQQCQMCHVNTAGAKGFAAPNLWGVVGRKAGSTQFAYSTALKNSGQTWDPKTLDTFLTAPGKLVPGTRMVVAIPDAKKRADVIAYLKTLH